MWIVELALRRPCTFVVEERPLGIAPLIIPPGLPSELLERRPGIDWRGYNVAFSEAYLKVAFSTGMDECRR